MFNRRRRACGRRALSTSVCGRPAATSAGRPAAVRQPGVARCLWGEDAVIADQGPHDVDLFARHGEQGLGVHLVLAAFVLVVLA